MGGARRPGVVAYGGEGGGRGRPPDGGLGEAQWGGPGSSGSAPPPPPALFFSLLVREALLPEPLSIGDTRPGAGWGGRPLRSPQRVPRSRPPLGWGRRQRLPPWAQTGAGRLELGLKGGGEKGEWVRRWADWLLEWGSSPWSLTAPRRPPRFRIWGAPKKRRLARDGGGAAVGGLSGKRGTLIPSSRRMAGLWLVEEPC